MGILGAIFVFLGSNSGTFLFFAVILTRNHIYIYITLIKILRGIRGSVYPIHYFRVCAKYEPSISRMVSNLAQNRHFPVEKCATFGAVRHIWPPYMAHTHKRHIGYILPQLFRRRFFLVYASQSLYFLRKAQKSTIYCYILISNLRLATEGDTADREPVVPVVVERGVDSARREVQVVGEVAIAADGGPVVAEVACVVQVAAWEDGAAPDKHQRRLHNSIRIS